MKSVAVLGATGYTGREAVRLLLAHPAFQVAHVTTTSRSGVALADVHPELRGLTKLVLEPYSVALGGEVDAVVSCLPHHESMAVCAELLEGNPGLKVVDLSADFRLPDPLLYEEVYGTPHVAAAALAEAAYGLPELFRDRIAGARLVANPGCYPTGALIPLAPLAKAGLLQEAIVSSVSGLSGAGASPSPTSHFVKANESVTAYKLYAHRHQPEIAVQLAAAAGGPVRRPAQPADQAPPRGWRDAVTFVPHLVPMDRGIHSTVYCDLNEPVEADEIAALYAAAYGAEPFVRLLPAGATPDTKWVAHTNFVDLGFAVSPDGNRVIALSALDNLLKGASGQAVQNLNVLFGFPETQGLLPASAVVPQVKA